MSLGHCPGYRRQIQMKQKAYPCETYTTGLMTFCPRCAIMVEKRRKERQMLMLKRMATEYPAPQNEGHSLGGFGCKEMISSNRARREERRLG